jgi:acyl-coenzyme A thioesterase PaaI-like protein
MGFDLTTVGDGEVTFTGMPEESVYNPIGVVHGGYVCTLLDSALGCAVQSILPAGVDYGDLTVGVTGPAGSPGSIQPCHAAGQAS